MEKDAVGDAADHAPGRRVDALDLQCVAIDGEPAGEDREERRRTGRSPGDIELPARARSARRAKVEVRSLAERGDGNVLRAEPQAQIHDVATDAVHGWHL